MLTRRNQLGISTKGPDLNMNKQLLRMAETITIKTLSATLITARHDLLMKNQGQKKIKSSYNGRGGGLPNSDFNTACRIQPTFDKVEPLMASIEAFLPGLNGDKQDESIIPPPPSPLLRGITQLTRCFNFYNRCEALGQK